MVKSAKKTRKPISPEEAISLRRERLRTRRDWLSLIFRLILIGAAGWILFTQVLLITQAKGQNMFPAVKDGDLVIAYRLQKEYVKNDIVVCEIDGGQYIGRIVANSGDVVTIGESGALVINGTTQGGEKVIYPTYAREPLTYPYKVPEGHVFLLGDYRTSAEDSRDFGPVPKEKVLGKVITILRRREL